MTDPVLHNATPADPRLDRTSCLVCGTEAYATTGGNGRVFAHADTDTIFSSRPAMEVPPPLPTIGLLIVRDPDGGTDVHLFVNGQRCDEGYDEITIDAGAGWTIEDWNESRAHDLAVAAAHGEEFAELVRSAYDDPPGSEWIEGWEDDDEDSPRVTHTCATCRVPEHDQCSGDLLCDCCQATIAAKLEGR